MNWLPARIAQSSEGAMVVFFPDIPELKDHPAMVRKSDGGFNYTTTDLATLQFRWKAAPGARNRTTSST